jgi:ParB/RepB/Spo0J family partition protein
MPKNIARAQQLTTTELPVADIDPSPRQPRKKFVGLDDLAKSIRQHGQLEPIMVRPVGQRYEIILGERRWRAAKLAGLTTIAATVREATEQQAFELGLVENVQRADLNPVEEANAYQELLDKGYTQDRVAKLVGKGRTAIAQKLRLLTLGPLPQSCLEVGSLTEAHARQLLRLAGILRFATTRPPVCPGVDDWAGYYAREMAFRVEDYQMSVRELEDWVDRLQYAIHCAGWIKRSLAEVPVEELRVEEREEARVLRLLRKELGLDYDYDRLPTDLTHDEYMWPVIYAAKRWPSRRDEEEWECDAAESDDEDEAAPECVARHTSPKK